MLSRKALLPVLSRVALSARLSADRSVLLSVQCRVRSWATA
jgi:hypothetical protein